ncbi:MAG: energy transducer TonB [Acidobacteriota bacterium]
MADTKKPVKPAAPAAAVDGGDEFSLFLLEDKEDSRAMKIAIAIAVAFHLVLFAINFGFLFPDEVEAEEEKEKKVYVVQQVRFKPPPPKQKQEIPKPKAKKVPIPDPTPDEPEPIVIDEPEPEVDIPDLDDVVFGIPDAPPAVPEPTGPLQVGGNVKKPEKISTPQPRYTEIARKARIQGVVIVQAIINKQGDVTNVKVLKGLPMGLDQEAVKAIKSWKFKPATLNGKPVEVYYNLTVNFRLQ